MLLASMVFRKEEDDDIFDVNVENESNDMDSITDSSISDDFSDAFGGISNGDAALDDDFDDALINESDIIGTDITTQEEYDASQPVSSATKDMISSVLSSISFGNVGKTLSDIEHEEDMAKLPPDPFADTTDPYADYRNGSDGCEPADAIEQPQPSTPETKSALSIDTSAFDSDTAESSRAGVAAHQRATHSPQQSPIAPASDESDAISVVHDNSGATDNKPSPEEESYRMVSRSVIALHYYYANACNWLLALDDAMSEVPALCLAFPDSPVNYHSLAEADHVARFLGYDGYEDIAKNAERLTADSRALSKFGEETGKWAMDYWFDGKVPAEISLMDYVIAIRNDIRGAWPMAKINAAQFAAMMSSDEDGNRTDELGMKTTPDGARVRFIGVNEISDRWNPESLIVQEEEAWKAAQALEDSIDRAEKAAEYDDLSDARLEELVSLAYLQCYQWNDRSWNKAVDVTKRLCESICTYAWASTSSEFSLPELETTRARVERMDELAAMLMNDDGNIELKTMTGADGRTYLDVESAEFKELYEEQKRVEAEYSVQMVVESLIVDMTNPAGSVASMLDDYIVSLATREHEHDEKKQLQVIESVKDKTLAIIDSKAKMFKSQWKKYLSAHKGDAEKIKERYIITGFDNGTLKFDAKAAYANN